MQQQNDKNREEQKRGRAGKRKQASEWIADEALPWLITFVYSVYEIH